MKNIVRIYVLLLLSLFLCFSCVSIRKLSPDYSIGNTYEILKGEKMAEWTEHDIINTIIYEGTDKNNTNVIIISHSKKTDEGLVTWTYSYNIDTSNSFTIKRYCIFFKIYDFDENMIKYEIIKFI